jgi:hypothetical protein
MFNEYEDIAAYAKIQSKKFVQFIKTTTVYLGRDVSLNEQSKDEEVIFIGDSNKISRKHLKIFLDDKTGFWYAQNLSKNHSYINKRILKNTDPPMVISPIAAIRIDDNYFYFFQAREE